MSTPPLLFAQWWTEGLVLNPGQSSLAAAYVARKAAQWGADQELKKCCAWLLNDPATQDIASRDARYLDLDLHAARRPKQPSLKQQALAQLEEIMDELHEATGSGFTASAIRRAIETLPDADS